MAWNSIISGVEIEDVKKDRKAARVLEKYRVSDQAIYFEGQYLPISAIRGMTVQKSTYSVKGCCGGAVPILKVGVDYGGEKPVVLLVEKEKSVDALAEIVTAGNPDVEVLRS